MKRRLYISALLVGTCVALVSRASVAQDAPAGEANPPEGDKPAEGDKPTEGQPEGAPTEPPAAEAPAAEAPAEPAPAAPAEEPATAEVAVGAEAQVPEPVTDEQPEAGYLPGYRRHPALGLSPYQPRTPAVPGGMTAPYGAPAPADAWSFNFTGYFSASVRTAVAKREGDVQDGQSETVLRNPLNTPDAYGAFTGTGSILGSWVSMTFEVGNRIVTARASLSTYNPSRPSSYTQISSQYFIDDAYLTFRLPQVDKLRLAWAVGAFKMNYGQLGQYGHLYGSTFVGNITGVGELLSAEYDLSDEIVLQAEHGFWGTYGRAPSGVWDAYARSPSSAPENQSMGWPDPSDPTPWMQAARVGVVRNGQTVIQAGLVFMSNWAQDDTGRDRVDDADLPMPPVPATPQDESNPKDPSMKAIGFESRVRGLWYHFGLAAVYGWASDAWNLRGMRFWVADGGENFTSNWLGINSQGNGSMWGVGTEVKVSWGGFARAPEPFWGEGWDVVTTIAAQVGSVDSDDPSGERDKGMYKFAIDNRAKFIRYLAAGLRFDRVVPNTGDGADTFHVLAPRLEFQSNWTSHETVTLQYAHWFYGDRPPYVNDDTPNTNLESDVVSLGFGMWW